jgi:cytochrome c oxidase cbb3-type subunit III
MYRTLLICWAVIGLLLEAPLFAQAPTASSRAATPAQAGQATTLDRNYTTFPQQTRKLASPDVLARGKGLYSVNCSACHGADLRGGDQGGPNLLRSLTALSDQHGELISPIIHGARQDKGMPAFNLSDADSTAVAEYVHSVLAIVGPKARPPGKVDIADKDVLVGNAAAGQTYFQTNCASCHSVTGDLKDVGATYKDPRILQNTWVAGGTVMGRGGLPAAGAHGKPSTVTVTFANGEKLDGTLIRKDDFIVTLLLADGDRRSISLENSGETPKVEIHDPVDAHRQLARNLSDNDMHNVTAYLATIK